jgi:hypothetical protein
MNNRVDQSPLSVDRAILAATEARGSMAIADLLEPMARGVIRETAGRVLAWKTKAADNQARIAEIVNLRATNATPLDRDDFIYYAATWSDDAEKRQTCAAVFHTIADVESGSIRGFDARGRATMLNEPHIFSAESMHAFDRSHPWLSYPKWVRYAKDAAPPAAFPVHPYSYSADDRWGLFAMQAELNFDAACCAISLGRFQQLVRGWKDLRFASPEALLRKLARTERDQLEVMLLYLFAHGLKSAVLARDWLAIARGYNGPGQAQAYASKMADAYAKRIARIYS